MASRVSLGEFLAWCDEHGLTFDSCAVSIEEGQNAEGVYCSAKRDIDCGEVLMKIPRKFCLNEETCAESSADLAEKLRASFYICLGTRYTMPGTHMTMILGVSVVGRTVRLWENRR
eukprot:1424234-Rhodomonas_salina.2